MNLPSIRMGLRLIRPCLAAVLLSLHVTAMGLAACESWHREAHQIQGNAPHHCLVTVFQSGLLDHADPTVTFVVEPRGRHALEARYDGLFCSPPDRLLPPGRAPPR